VGAGRFGAAGSVAEGTPGVGFISVDRGSRTESSMTEWLHQENPIFLFPKNYLNLDRMIKDKDGKPQ